MGKEGGKPAWPKPSRRYQTITGRRYGRRYAYVGFTPSSNSQVRDEHQHNEDCERLELEDIQKANYLRPSPPVQVSSGLLDEPLLENTGTGEPVCENVSSRTLEANMSPFSLFSYCLEGNQISGNFMNPYENSENLAEYATAGCNDWNGQNGIAFVNMDSYESDGDHAQDKFSLGTEEPVVFWETINKIFSEFEKGIESFTDSHSQLSNLNHSVTRECCEEAGPMPLMRYFSRNSDLACPNNRTFETSAEDQATLKSNPSDAVHEAWQIKDIENVGIQMPIAIANELNVSDDQENSLELVVKPKIRKQNTSNQLERERLLLDDEEGESSSWRRTETDEVQQGCAECALNIKEISSSMFFGSRGHEGHQKNTELRKNAAAQEQKNVLEDSAFWDGFEDYSRHFSMYHKDEDSSECSDGEWSAAAPTYFTATEKDYSSDESCETIPGRKKCEPGVQSSSSNGVEEESKDYRSQGREQMLLEEGEIPHLQYREVENISVEETNLIRDFVYSGFYLLNGNNNFEDDSSESEELDGEWRLSEFGDGLGLAQAASNAEPLTLEALEERLQEAMELLVLTTSKSTELQKQLHQSKRISVERPCPRPQPEPQLVLTFRPRAVTVNLIAPCTLAPPPGTDGPAPHVRPHTVPVLQGDSATLTTQACSRPEPILAQSRDCAPGHGHTQPDTPLQLEICVPGRTFSTAFKHNFPGYQKIVDEDAEVFHKFKNVISFTERTALAHLELLGFGVEQAHPPATKETIDSLPQIIITNDQDGQEQHCTICCCDYVEKEIVTELPCHHFFHRTCVTHWLQESGTCPVCRHVLAPVPPETAAPTVSFLPDHDSASSAHSVTGTSN